MDSDIYSFFFFRSGICLYFLSKYNDTVYISIINEVLKIKKILQNLINKRIVAFYATGNPFLFFGVIFFIFIKINCIYY